jgi:hypothetical protein
MLSHTGIREKPMINKSSKTVLIRQKIKEIFGSDCELNDDLLLKRYTITTDGDLVVIVK